MPTILSIIGTRPEGIKMAPVIRELSARAAVHPSLRSVVVSTGQHREMLAPVLELFGIRPDVDLGLMQPNQTLSRLTAALFGALDPVVAEHRPDWIVAQGDTTSVMVAALVAFYHRVAFGHVEAGLRTGDYQRPFPEEMNRRIADLDARAYFAPTARSRDALLAEGVPAGRIHVTGNTVVDALLQAAALPYEPARGPLADLPPGDRLVLITAHRRESFGEPFRELCRALRDLATSPAGRSAQFVYPVHLNPNVRGPVGEILAGLPNVHLREPFAYPDLVQAMKRSALILTDSGGIQEEAPSFGVPVLVMRDTTERPEGVEAGVVELVGTDRARIVAAATRHLAEARLAVPRPNPYGDGRAAARIVDVLLGAA
ncbi:MAG: non-hydrolyzing UDP-N-acetylglucosamine 2-epimerase [Verrucomicrobiota bacterium]